jgi:CheY-like chemotaxis protein
MTQRYDIELQTEMMLVLAEVLQMRNSDVLFRGIDDVSVLLIEDDELARDIIEGVLTASGLAVTSVPTGEEAMELFEQGCSFELLLTDIRLPGRYDGWALAIEARRFSPEIAVIYMTASHQQSCPVTRSVFLRKPIRPKLLLEIVGALLDRSLHPKLKPAARSLDIGIGFANYLH